MVTGEEGLEAAAAVAGEAGVDLGAAEVEEVEGVGEVTMTDHRTRSSVSKNYKGLALCLIM